MADLRPPAQKEWSKGVRCTRLLFHLDDGLLGACQGHSESAGTRRTSRDRLQEPLHRARSADPGGRRSGQSLSQVQTSFAMLPTGTNAIAPTPIVSCSAAFGSIPKFRTPRKDGFLFSLQSNPKMAPRTRTRFCLLDSLGQGWPPPPRPPPYVTHPSHLPVFGPEAGATE